MYCQFCGKQVEDNAEVCAECGKTINSSKKRSIDLKKDNSLFFWCMILVGPMITTMFYFIVFVNRWIYNQTDNVFLSLLDLIPLEYIIFLIIVINLVIYGKIKTAKFCLNDAIIWTVFWMMQFMSSRLISSILLPEMSTYYHILNHTYWSVEHLLFLQDFWGLFCWFCYIVCRNNDTLITFKKGKILGIGLVVYSLLFFMFGNWIVIEIAHNVDGLYELLIMFKISALTMFIRHFILFFLAICLAKKKIGLCSGLISIIGFFVIRFSILLFPTIYEITNILVAIADTAGYLYMGIVILITLLINPRNNVGEEAKE